MAKNEYALKLAARKRAEQLVVMRWAMQAAFDGMMLCLNDPEVMGKDTFGVKRFKKLEQPLAKYCEEIMVGLTNQPGASHARRLTDERLQRICGVEFVPWCERYQDFDDRGI